MFKLVVVTAVGNLIAKVSCDLITRDIADLQLIVGNDARPLDEFHSASSKMQRINCACHTAPHPITMSCVLKRDGISFDSLSF